ncbi:MAG: hypothetical protein A2W98_04820 [Bacteroidetes bacterium GWF2_33_38]|nr:MAG: hypothetical protein A2W98_04820 [Bacteroidetes bacterium GWF2_33_38]OFY76151.1 MAG: hypothetical protein A2265_07715 [Bacteroidetes bacterium RIFOXYA12_FULL_33_9]OFY91708.1 MAG: hypothetical protein A2236_07190 [Bacteroidetes bacterium RIFOXYA2_FULL_33_7]
MRNFLAFVLIFASTLSFSQETVTFFSSDSLEITADFYEAKAEFPYVLLFHQAGSSRGEYRDVAKRFQKLGYNCLAVDLRSGGEENFVPNETAKKAITMGFPNNYLETKKDIEAAVEYAYKKSNQKVVLVGSSYSASLSLVIGKTNDKVKAIVALSPGEFFKPLLDVKQEITGLTKPVFVGCSQREFPYAQEYESVINSKQKVFFKPQDGPGEHGAKSLWEKADTGKSDYDSSKEYWMALLVFFNQIKG